MTSKPAHIAIVTGAAGGIGLAVAERLASDGVRVLAADLKAPPSSLGPEVEFIQADLTDPAGIELILAEARAAGRLDYLVNAAGIAWFDRDGSVFDIGEDVWDTTLRVNLGITRGMCVAGQPLLDKGEGRAIVNVASMAGLRNMDSPLDAYQVSKAAVVSLSRSLAEQLGPSRIRCNTVCPGAILTPMIAFLYEQSPARREAMELRTPLRRLGTPKDVASAVAFLLSDEASFITGTDLVVDGGWIIQTK